MSLLIASAFAIEVGLAFTHHTLDRPGPDGWNEIHPSVTLSFEDAFAKNDIIAGVYYNSEAATSFFIGVEFDDVFIEGLNFEVGAVTGYASAEVLPMVRATYDITNNMEAFIFPVVTLEKEGGTCGPTWCTAVLAEDAGTTTNYGIGFGINMKFSIR